jgi:hypothetical protein
MMNLKLGLSLHYSYGPSFIFECLPLLSMILYNVCFIVC